MQFFFHKKMQTTCYFSTKLEARKAPIHTYMKAQNRKKCKPILALFHFFCSYLFWGMST